jgi:peptidoglycan/xylan/chitin deacetylase (PgdA/CDA1 family)
MATKTACLTIDDSPSSVMTEKIDYLAARGIPAVWFCRGDLLTQRADAALCAIGKGFIIGNHSWDHPYFSDLTLEQGFSQIKRTDALIEELYERAGAARPAKFFRFPYGDKGGLTHADVRGAYSEAGLARKRAFQDCLRALGYRRPDFAPITHRYYRAAGLADDLDWYWTYDVMQWSIFQPDPMSGVDSIEKVFSRMEEDEPEGGRGLNNGDSAEIVLVHDHPETHRWFTAIMERLRVKGLVFAAPIP